MKEQIELFKQLQEFVDKMNFSNSSLDKIAVLRQYHTNNFIKKVLEYTYNPFFNFYVTPANCLDKIDMCEGDHIDIFELLDDLRLRYVTGYAAIAAVNNFKLIIGSELVYKIINKNLEIRIDVKTINKVFPNLIPTYSVALAETFNDKTNKKVDFIKDRWFMSRKLDGCRMQIIINEAGDINAYSRSGNEFFTMNRIKEQFREFAKKNRSIVFDGEICIVDPETNQDDFSGIVSQIKRKDYTIENAKYYVFDAISLSTFNDISKGDTFYQRQIDLLKMTRIINSPMIVYLEQTFIESKQELDDANELAIENNWEGLILRKDTYYKNGRSSDLLKVKMWQDEEFNVKRI